jgi:lysophospholipase L1-like esterase
LLHVAFQRKAKIMNGHFDHESNDVSRRRFLQATTGVTAASMAAIAASSTGFAQAAGASTTAGATAVVQKPLLRAGDVILFQGDSITDSGRKKDNAEANSQPALGNGYAWLAASELLVSRPDDKFTIFNRGISGNKVFQLSDRWDADCLALKPTVLSILIGVNDYWHKKKHSYEGTLEKYEKDYTDLLVRTKTKLPGVRLVVCEPFALKVFKEGGVDESWFPEFDGYRAAAKKVAQGAGAVFVPFQSMFDEAVKLAPPERWAADGVHPTADGAALMAHTWLKAVGA